MKVALTIAAAMFALSAASIAQHSSQYGSADEAKTMLLKAVVAVKADKAAALDMFNKGEGGFLDRDLYVFCANVSDGTGLAIGNPNAKNILGADWKKLTDSTGKGYGLEIYQAGQRPEGQITEVRGYLFVRPGSDTAPLPKTTFVTRAGDIYCGVGYYTNE